MIDQTAKSPISLHTDFCEDAINAALRAVDDLMGKDGERPHIFAFGLYATILELASGALSLAQLQRYAGLPVLLRSIYEAHLDLQNLLRDADYSLNMEAADAEEQLKLVAEAPTNRFLAGITFNANSERHRLRARLAELRTLGRPPLTIKQRAILAGRQEQHAVSYRLLCLDGHNNTSALADRHFTEVDGERFVSFFGEPHLPNLFARLHVLIYYVIESTKEIHAAFQTESPAVAELMERFTREKHEMMKWQTGSP